MEPVTAAMLLFYVLLQKSHAIGKPDASTWILCMAYVSVRVFNSASTRSEAKVREAIDRLSTRGSNKLQTEEQQAQATAKDRYPNWVSCDYAGILRRLDLNSYE